MSPIERHAEAFPRADESIVELAAKRLSTAASTAVPCTPIRDLVHPEDVATAYRVQERFNAGRPGPVAEVVGRKIGVTSEAVQQQLGVQQPDFGVLFADMAYEDGAIIPWSRLLQPRAEAEIAFILGADLVDGPLDVEQCRSAVSEAAAALEIVDSRIAGWDITFADTVADNASSGVFVLGSQRMTLSEFEPVDVVMSMSIDGVEQSTGTGADCLGDPLNALAWLAQRAREFGNPLRARQVVLSGALGPMRAVCAGATVTASIHPLGTVTTSFTTDNEEPS